MRASVLLVDDDSDMRAALEGTLLDAGFSVTTCAGGRPALHALGQSDFDVVVTDLRMPGIDGVHLCTKITGSWPALPVILITAFGDLDAALAAMRAGAFDFITKPFSDGDLLLAMERALRYRATAPDVRRVASLPNAEPRGQLLGDSPPMQELRAAIATAARGDVPALLEGEPGTGRELAARLIHAQGARAAGPFVPVACAATPEAVEETLFGGSPGNDDALLAVAEGGTLFLRDVTALPLALQTRVLTALATIEGSRPPGARVRLMASTDVALGVAVDRGQVLAELRDRFGAAIAVPPLRHRGGDILDLARHFLGRSGHGAIVISEAAAARLARYPWPGNVRELRDCIESAAVVARDGLIEPAALPARVQVHAPGRSRTPEVGSLTLEAVERAHIESVMQATSGNKARAASLLGIDRTTLYRKLKHYEPDS